MHELAQLVHDPLVIASALSSVAMWMVQNAINVLIQSTALILIGLTAAWLLNRHGSAVQSAVYRATLIAVLLCPFASAVLNLFGVGGWSIQLPATETLASIPAENEFKNRLGSDLTRTASDQTVAPLAINSRPSGNATQAPTVGNLPMGQIPNAKMSMNSIDVPGVLPSEFTPHESTGLTESQLSQRRSSNFIVGTIYPLIAGCWLVGVSVFLCRLIFAYFRLDRLRRQSIVAEATEQAACKAVADRVGVTAPNVLRNPLLSSPCLSGIVSPAILIPTDIQHSDLLEQAFAHEMAHLRRRDNVWNLVQRIGLSIYFFQPLLWRLVVRLETTAEEVCDDVVVKLCCDRTGYAQQLVTLAESNLLAPNLAGIGMFNGKSVLGHRIGRILDTTRQLTTQISGAMLTGIAMLTLACGMLGGLIGNAPSPLGTAAAESFSKTHDEKIESENEEIVRLAGTVVDHLGNPVKGATVRIHPYISQLYGNEHPTDYATTLTRADGTYSASFPASRLIMSGHSFPREGNFMIVASAPGHGVAWLNPENLEAAKEPGGNRTCRAADLKLAADDIDFKLRLIDLQSNPIADAELKIQSVTKFPNNDLADFFQRARSGKFFQELMNIDAEHSGMAEFPTFRSDKNGMLNLKGIGRGRIANVLLTGDLVAQNAYLAISQEKSVSVTLGGSPKSEITIFGANSTIVCEPSQPISGCVVDRLTNQPLAGVTIVSDRFAGAQFSGDRKIRTVSDADGNFRLVGMPKGPGNVITAVPNNDLPYFMMDFDVPTGVGLDPVDMKLGLERGVWIRGKLTDKETGKPVPGARLHYIPFLSNQYAAKTAAFTTGVTPAKPLQNRHHTANDGTFKIVGLPGKAVIGVVALSQPYPVGQGWEDLDPDDIDDKDRLKTFGIVIPPSRNWPHALKQIDIADGQLETDVEIQLGSGFSIPIQIVDSELQPVVGVKIQKLRGSHDYVVSKESRLNATGFGKNQQRYLLFHHPGKRLGAVQVLDSSVLDDDGQLAEAIRVQLMPTSKFTGQLKNADGHPIQGAGVVCSIDGARDFGDRLPTVSTDKDGIFVVDPVYPNTSYSIHAEGSDRTYSICKRAEVGAGEEIDLGIIDVSTNDRPELLRKKLAPTATTDQSRSVNSRPQQPLFRLFSGKLVDEQGHPIPNASVNFNVWNPFPNVNLQTLANTKSDLDGKFDLAVDRKTLASKDFSKTGNDRGAIVVHTAGFGSREIPWRELGREPLTLQLEPENIIIGQIVGLEGVPVVGADVEVTYAKSLGKRRADQWIKKLKRTADYSQTTDLIWNIDSPEMYWISDACNLKIKTDDQGRFKVRGIPSDSRVSFQVQHPEITTQLFQVLNRAMPIIDADPRYKVFGDRPLVITQPCRPIVGKVVDAKTNLPLTGVKIYCREMGIEGTVYGSSAAPQTHTDSDGRFELVGMPKSPGNRLMVYPPTDQPYLIKEVDQIPDSVGLEPVELSIKLDRGVWISGKVIDKQTGQGVRSKLRYFPLADNPYYLATEGFQASRRQDHYTFFDNYATRADGTFRVIGLPGKAVLGATVENEDYRPGVGYKRIFDLWSQNYSPERIRQYASAGIDLSNKKFLNLSTDYSFNNAYGSSFIAIEPTEAGLALESPIELDPGKDVEIKVVDPDGKPVSRFSVSKPNGFWGEKEFENGIAVLTRMGDDEARRISIESKTSPMAVIVSVTTHAKSLDDRTITIYPFAKIRGRLTDKQGQPLVGYPIRVNSSNSVTNDLGEFLLEGLIVGIPEFDLTITRPAPADETMRPQEMGNFIEVNFAKELSPGKTLELGDVEVDPTDSWWISG